MRAKKFLALLLSGMVLAGCLSGCNRTIIEHQFHTDTEYIETIVENSGMNGAEKLTDLFLTHGIELNIMYMYEEVDDGALDDSSFLKYELETTPIEDDDISWFYTFQTTLNASAEYGQENGVIACLTRSIKCDDISDMSFAWQVYANSVYEALMKYLDEHNWEWEKMDENIGVEASMLKVSSDSTNPEFYAIFSLG